KGPDAALAEDHIVIAVCQNVFSGHSEFFESEDMPSFNRIGFARSLVATQQRKILHVSSANLYAIGIALHEIKSLEFHPNHALTHRKYDRRLEP
ncbi:MAG TPA: hypothetical protein VGL97_21395, partial [Bryobacteraceae bacterium]